MSLGALSSDLDPAPGPGRLTPTVSDRALVAAACEGSRDAFSQLYRRYWPLAYRTAYLVIQDRGLAEDITQEVFLAAVRNLDRFDRRRPFGPWLARIATNRAIDAARARTRRGESILDERLAGEDPTPGAGAAIRLIGALPVDQRAVVALRYVFDLTPGEIARVLDLPRGTVNSRLRRGLDVLQDAMGEERS